MKTINEVLREYWRATYKGKDIDEVNFAYVYLFINSLFSDLYRK